MKKLLLPGIVVIASLAGAGGGYFAKNALQKPAGESAHTAADSSAKKKDQSGSKAKSKGHGGEAAGTAPSYMKFSRQFVVPIVKGGAPRMMMILDVNIAVDDALSEKVYQYEPQLRDAMLQALLNLASEDVLQEAPVNKAAMTAVKARLLESARLVVGDGASEVLIQDLGLQTY